MYQEGDRVINMHYGTIGRFIADIPGNKAKVFSGGIEKVWHKAHMKREKKVETENAVNPNAKSNKEEIKRLLSGIDHDKIITLTLVATSKDGIEVLHHGANGFLGVLTHLYTAQISVQAKFFKENKDVE